MIDIHVQGSAWPEVAQELRKMLGDEPQIVVAKEQTGNQSDVDQLKADLAALDKCCRELADEKEDLETALAEADGLIGELKADLAAQDALIDDLKDTLNAKDVRIAELEKQLADAKAPQQSEPTKGDTEPDAPEEEQTEIPEVTEAPVKEYKKEEVRAVLMKCRAANIAITEVLAPYGGSLGAVKKEDYAKVVEAAEKALEGK